MPTYICDGPMMARDRTSGRGLRRCGLKGEPEAPPNEEVAGPALPTAQHEGLRAYEFHIDSKVAHLSACRRVEPAQELAQTVAVRDDVHRRPVDWRLVVDRVRGGEERKHGILGYAGSILVDKVGPIVGLQGEREIVPGPLSRRTCMESFEY
jgi:hypothetical protein